MNAADARASGEMPVIDAHLHIIDPERFNFSGATGYHPLPHERGPHESLMATLAAHGVGRGVLVQPSCYGCDPSAMLDAMAASGGRLKGISWADVDATAHELEALRSRGVVGVRLNLDYERRDLNGRKVKQWLAAVRAMEWWVEVQGQGRVLIETIERLRDARVKVLVDHWGRPDLSDGPGGSAFGALLRHGREGETVVKLSAPYRVSAQPPPHADLDPFADALLSAFTPRRCVWGSDWPFINTPERPDYATARRGLERWVSGDALHEVLCTTPARVFGFEW